MVQKITKAAMMLIPLATLVLVYMVYQKTCNVDSNTKPETTDEDPNKK